jgi:DUF1009 family protein
VTVQPRKLGLICGSGQFPMLVAAGARRSGREVVAVGIRGLADPALTDVVDEFHWSSIVRLGRVIRILRRRGCERAILAGSVRKAEMYEKSGVRRFLYYWPDWTTIRVWFFRAADKRPDSLLRAIAEEFAAKGILLDECCKFTPEAMAAEGVLTSRRPTAAQQKDIEFGWRMAKELGRLDIGQSVAVKEQDVIAVEAIEGTDRMIQRAGELCKSGGWCHIKVSKPNQDMRFDVPTIGPQTIENLARHGAKVLCVEAGKTFMVDPQRTLALAESLGMVVIGMKRPD